MGSVKKPTSPRTANGNYTLTYHRYGVYGTLYRFEETYRTASERDERGRELRKDGDVLDIRPVPNI
ncbi:MULTISPECIES: hypothetical protein [Amycolatopsis]|uniref:hypothetical protein n=1 Tax=Amycolatopsis TaxID=1813 RepID=UPI000B8AD71E|nr:MULTISPECIES: hypothetical protein [Amycolatopsis]OXM70737.1 hypothetical protein CF166_20575 [Amycolatopsis sp. KNN50.9b]